MRVIVTGSSGLVGSSVVRACLDRGDSVVGFDNDMRARFFGDQASTGPNREKLLDYAEAKGGLFRALAVDISNRETVSHVFGEVQDRYGQIGLVVHCAAQPSHDWAASNPHLDFAVNAMGTLNMLTCTQHHAPDAVFVHVSTNKVYGDRPNEKGYVELETRFESIESASFYNGFDESMSIDQATHSVFGASKLAADIMAQEYGRYFGMKTGIFRCGCLTGAGHAGAQQHGFLSYLIKTAVAGEDYTIFGYGGKQVRDNLHADDLADAFLRFADDPDPGAVYNMGGGRENSCSVLEAIMMVKERGYAHREVLHGPERTGDHRWWITNTEKFERRYPDWRKRWSLHQILDEMTGSLA